jgi:hypothetical protein
MSPFWMANCVFIRPTLQRLGQLPHLCAQFGLQRHAERRSAAMQLESRNAHRPARRAHDPADQHLASVADRRRRLDCEVEKVIDSTGQSFDTLTAFSMSP